MLSGTELSRRLRKVLCPLLLASGMLIVFGSASSIGTLSVFPFLLIAFLTVTAAFFTGKPKGNLLYTAILILLFSLWCIFGGGINDCLDLIRAIVFRIRGVDYSLPLLGTSAICILAYLFSIVGILLTNDRLSSVPVILLTAGFTLIVWFFGNLSSIIGLAIMMIPAVLTAIRNKHEGMDVSLHVILYVSAIIGIALLILPLVSLTGTSLKSKTDQFRQHVFDRFFFTEPRDVFSLADFGYYPQSTRNSMQLGGKAVPSDDPVLQVSTEKTAYLRGVILDFYDGRSWSNSTGGRRYLYNGIRWKNNRAFLFDEKRTQLLYERSAAIKHRVNIRALSSLSSTLFVPQRPAELNAGGDMVIYFNNASELFATRNLEPGDTYSVTSPLLTSDDPGIDILVKAASDIEDPEYEQILGVYTQLPEHLEAELYTIARKASAGEYDNYSKAKAIMNWLRRNFRYNLDIGPQPENIDFVSHFLINTQEGYCTHFASAMTVLCRMIGLPARYIEGFLAEPDKDGHAYLTGKQAHAWTEVYFPSFGWLTFDATPGSTDTAAADNNINQSSNKEDNTEPERNDASESDKNNTDKPDTSENGTSEQPDNDHDDTAADSEEEHGFSPALFTPVIILLLMLIYAVIRYILSDPRRKEKGKVPNEKIAIWINDTFAVLAAEHKSMYPGETPLAFMSRLERETAYDVPLMEYGNYISYFSYSNSNADNSAVSYFATVNGNIKKEFTFTGKLRYIMYRIGLKKL